MRIGVVQEDDSIYVAHINEAGTIVGGGRMIRIRPDGKFELCTGTDLNNYGLPVDGARRIIVRGYNDTSVD